MSLIFPDIAEVLMPSPSPRMVCLSRHLIPLIDILIFDFCTSTGYYLATAAEDATIKLWDLRKLKNFKTIALEDRYEVKERSVASSAVLVQVHLCRFMIWSLIKVECILVWLARMFGK